jgi:hypothetical protein
MKAAYECRGGQLMTAPRGFMAKHPPICGHARFVHSPDLLLVAEKGNVQRDNERRTREQARQALRQHFERRNNLSSFLIPGP